LADASNTVTAESFVLTLEFGACPSGPPPAQPATLVINTNAEIEMRFPCLCMGRVSLSLALLRAAAQRSLINCCTILSSCLWPLSLAFLNRKRGPGTAPGLLRDTDARSVGIDFTRE